LCSFGIALFESAFKLLKPHLGGGFKCFLFSPLFEEIIQLDEHIFQMGWFNHQLEMYIFIYETHQHRSFKAIVETPGVFYFPGSKSVGKPFVAPTNLAERLREVGDPGRRVSDES